MVMIRTPVSARAFFSWVSERPSRTPLSAKSFRISAIFIPRSAVSFRNSGRGSWGLRMRFSARRSGFTSSSCEAVSVFTETARVTLGVCRRTVAPAPRQRLSIAPVLALVEDHRADDDPALDDLLPVGRHVDEVEGVVEHADDQRAHDGAGDGADAAGGERGSADHCRGDSVELVPHPQTRLTRADARGDDQAGQSGEHAGVGVDEDLVPAYVDAGDPSRLLVAADGIDVLPELGPRVEDVRREGHDD